MKKCVILKSDSTVRLFLFRTKDCVLITYGSNGLISTENISLSVVDGAIDCFINHFGYIVVENFPL